MHLIKKTNAFVVRLVIVKHLTEFSLRAFVLQVVLPVAAVSVCSAMVPVLLKVMIKSTVAEFFAEFSFFFLDLRKVNEMH